MNKRITCYICRRKFKYENKVEASHNGIPVQLCESCGKKAGLIE